MKAVLWSSGARGLLVASALVEEGNEIVAAVVPREKKVLTEKFAELGIPVLQLSSRSRNEIFETISRKRVDLGVVAGFPNRLPRFVFSAPRLGTVNLHSGPLPSYRGGSPLSWQIVNGEREIGVCLHMMDEGFDTGPIVSSDRFELAEDEYIDVARERADDLFYQLMKAFLRNPVEGVARAQQQSELGSNYWHQRQFDDAMISWRTMSAEEVVNLVRATSPVYGGAFTFFRGFQVRILRARRYRVAVGGVPGRVLRLFGSEYPIVVCKDGAVELESYRLGGRWFRVRTDLPAGSYLGPN